jgi:hypothetical protein
MARHFLAPREGRVAGMSLANPCEGASEVAAAG